MIESMIDTIDKNMNKEQYMTIYLKLRNARMT